MAAREGRSELPSGFILKCPGQDFACYWSILGESRPLGHCYSHLFTREERENGDSKRGDGGRRERKEKER